MKPRPQFQMHPGESISATITRMYKHVRSIQADIKPGSHYASRIAYKKAMKPKLHLVK